MASKIIGNFLSLLVAFQLRPYWSVKTIENYRAIYTGENKSRHIFSRINGPNELNANMAAISLFWDTNLKTLYINFLFF